MLSLPVTASLSTASTSTVFFEPLIASSRLTVSTSLPDDAALARTDRKKVKQIVMNLLSNAIKFTPEGFVRVLCSYDAPGDRFAISVVDTGVGIPPDQQDDIFEEFHQVDDTSTRSQGGTGLGLSISKRLAEVIRGSIELVSRPGAGSTFTLHFPADLS